MTPLEEKIYLLGENEAPPPSSFVVGGVMGDCKVGLFVAPGSQVPNDEMVVCVAAATNRRPVVFSGPDAPLLAATYLVLGRRQPLAMVEATVPGLTEANREALRQLVGGAAMMKPAARVQPPRMIPPRSQGSVPLPPAHADGDRRPPLPGMPVVDPVYIPGVEPGDRPMPEGPLESVDLGLDRTVRAADTAAGRDGAAPPS